MVPDLGQWRRAGLIQVACGRLGLMRSDGSGSRGGGVAEPNGAKMGQAQSKWAHLSRPRPAGEVSESNGA